MTEHALDAMIYAWRVMKEKEENKMDNVFMGQIIGSCSQISEEDGKRCACIYFHDTESNACSKLSHCNKTYSLVLSDDVIKTNDELLKLREKVSELEEELIEIKTTRNLREAYITGVEKGCESLREERDYWKDRFGSVVTDVSKVLESDGVEFTVKAIDGNKWNVGIDIPELNEAKKKVEDLEKKLKAAKSNETFWRDRKEEEEDYHHYWLHTFDRAVKQAAEKGIHIDVRGTDEECNAGIVVVDNVKVSELESQIVALEKTNNNLNQKIGAADNALEYWNNTYNDIVIAGKNVGVKIDIKGKKPDSNAGFVYVTNEKALELAYKLNTARQIDDKKWQAMTEALKAKGVEVIYMGEEGGKPIIDIKVPGWDKDKEWVTTFLKQCADIRADKFRLERERDELKEKCDILRKDGALKGQQCLKLKADLADLKKEHNRVLGEFALCRKQAVCHKPVSKEGPGRVRRLSTEEVEGPACSDFKARKE